MNKEVRSLALSTWLLALLSTATAAAVPLQTPRTHGGFFSFAFSDNGQMLAGGSGVIWEESSGKVLGGGEALLWDAASGKLLATLGSQGATVDWTSFSSDGSRVATASQKTGTIKVWDVPGRRLLQTFKLPEGRTARSTSPNILLCALAPDGRHLAAVGAIESKLGAIDIANSGSLVIWDVATGKQVAVIGDSDVAALAFSPDGATLVAATRKVTWKQEGDGVSGIHSDPKFVGWETSNGKRKFAEATPGLNPSSLVTPTAGDAVVAVPGDRAIWIDPATGRKTREVAFKDSKTQGPMRVSGPHVRLDAAGNRLLLMELLGAKAYAVDLSTGLASQVYDSKNRMNGIFNPALAPNLRRAAGTQMGRPVLVDF